MEPTSLFWSTGIAKYYIGERGGFKLILEIDPDLTRYYRSLLPPRLPRLQLPQFPAHISVVRKEVPPNMQFWGKYEGEIVPFAYSNVVENSEIYYWINCYSKRLEEIRTELGLPNENLFKIAPEPFCTTFHTTIGNLKNQNK